jgi:ubiquinone/menaquinone biosynthesis C-methylase UbiE
MAEHDYVYSHQADLYEHLILREDYNGNLPLELEKISSFTGLDVLELGAGTGRLTRWLAQFAARITALDLSPHMLVAAKAILRSYLSGEITLAVGDHRTLPVPTRSSDIIISGWSVCYLVSWHPGEWCLLLEKALREMNRAIRPGGKIILIETLGTGCKTPDPPEKLVPYYHFLEESGFKTTWLRTDYRFESMEEAREITRFFFGDEMLSKISNGAKPILPECSGIWWLG